MNEERRRVLAGSVWGWRCETVLGLCVGKTQVRFTWWLLFLRESEAETRGGLIGVVSFPRMKVTLELAC